MSDLSSGNNTEFRKKGRPSKHPGWVTLSYAATQLNETAYNMNQMARNGDIPITEFDGKKYAKSEKIKAMVAAKKAAETAIGTDYDDTEKKYYEDRFVELKAENPSANAVFYLADIVKEEIWINRIRVQMQKNPDKLSQRHLSQLMSDARARYDNATKVLKIQPQQDPNTVSDVVETFSHLVERASKMKPALIDPQDFFVMAEMAGIRNVEGREMMRIRIYPKGLKDATVEVMSMPGTAAKINFGEEPLKLMDAEMPETAEGV